MIFLDMCAMQAGLRAYVGKVCMDRNSKDYYVNSPEQNLADTEAFLNHVRCQPPLAERGLYSRISPSSCKTMSRDRDCLVHASPSAGASHTVPMRTVRPAGVPEAHDAAGVWRPHWSTQ